MELIYAVNDSLLKTEDYLDLVQDVWPGSFSFSLTEQALTKTVNITAWHDQKLVGCVRILTDGYFFGTIPEILVRPSYQGKGIGTKLMELAWAEAPTSLFFGSQPGKESFYERLGYEKSLQSFGRKKPRRC